MTFRNPTNRARMGTNQRVQKRLKLAVPKAARVAKVSITPNIPNRSRKIPKRQPCKTIWMPTKEQDRVLRRLYDIHCRIRSLKSSKRYTKPHYTVLDNGSHVTLIGYEDRVIKNKHQSWIKSSGALGTHSIETLRLVDALTVLVNHAGDLLLLLAN